MPINNQQHFPHMIHNIEYQKLFSRNHEQKKKEEK